MWGRLVIAVAGAGCSFHGGHARPDDAQALDGAPVDAIDDGGAPDGGNIDANVHRLVDRGLVVRYLIDEATAGQTPTQLADVAPTPLPLAITYTAELAFAAPNGHRGLEWSSTAGINARADVAIIGTKIAQRLTGVTKLTLEIVVDVKAVGANCRIMTLSQSTTGYGQASLLTFDLQNISFFLDGTATVWAVLQNTGRHVLTGVIDTTLATPGDRMQLYIDGVLATRNGGTDPAQNLTLALAGTEYFTLGNVDTGARSFIGDEFYAALYDVALAPSEVLQNAAALMADDDRE